MKKNLLLLLPLAAIFTKTNAQCTAPTSATVSATNITCAGSGAVSVNSVTGSAGSIALTDCRFALYDATNTMIVKPIQSSPLLSGLNAGSYILHIQQVCQPSGISTDYTQTVQITGAYNPPILNTPTTVQPICGNDGVINATAAQGYGGYQYCLVDSLNAPSSPTHYVMPIQGSGSFTGLASGDYYLRVYDGCNGFVTRKVTIPAAIVTPGNPLVASTYKFGCPNFSLHFNMAYTAPSSAIKNTWIVFPDGTTDSVTMGQSGADYTVPQSKISVYPATCTIGYKDPCGNVWTKPYTFNQPNYTLNQSYSASQYDCNSGTFTNSSVTITDQANTGSGQGMSGASNIWNQYSVDGGITWLPYKSTDTLLVTKGGSRTIMYQNTCANLTDTVTLNMAAGQNPLIFSLGTGLLHCNDKVTINYSVSSYNGPLSAILVQVLSTPSGQPAIPDFYYTGGFVNTNIRLMNILPGTYTIRMTDQCGATSIQTITLNPFIPVTYAAQPVFACGSNTISIKITATTSFYKVDGSVAYKIYNSAGTLVASNPWLHNSAGVFSETVDNLPPDIYTVSAFETDNRTDNRLTLDTVCATIITVNATLPGPLTLSQTTFAKCTNDLTTGTVIALPQGGIPPYAYTLYKSSVTPANIAAGPQSGNVFSNLDVNTQYIITATDQCGAGASYTNVFANVQPVLAASSPYVPCIGDSIKLWVTKNPGLSYQWTKNNINIAGATDTSYSIKPMTMADSGAYTVAINANNCILLSTASQLNPKNCGLPIPLEIDLINFSGSLNAQIKAVLNWEVAKPEAGAEFEVLYSTDGTHFSSAGKIYQDGSRKDFSFTHNLQIIDKAYYKLLMTENNGKESYSKVIVLHNENGGATATVTVSPIPFVESFDLIYTAAQNDNALIQISDVNSRTVKTQQSVIKQGANSIRVSGLGILANGIYFLNITTDKGDKQVVKIQK
ncbi:T9SS type A sorting domain-containing protein [Taibaiella soli]|uniref:Secretion system C-terminal sorting domain-containing protein n=1 Tax=Taibaiella soli TaxID=1649169 RepID=A0A2W2AHY8_9BACT|nr:T9SS type A sorting domain-containing protein [Taibaiella soli]PZF71860.1 hypothetical protein DN068_17550 [Taibaiella soli]